MKLKEIPENTVVHTPKEQDARELLTILHENGYKWKGGGSMADTLGTGTIYNIKINERTDEYDYEHCVSLTTSNGITLAEFKEQYCEDEKPQPKLHLGERVRIVSNGEEDFINMITKDDCYELLEHRGKYMESDLEPYTEPETKPTEDMETKELNLCELLQGHEGESIFLTTMGEVLVEKVSEEHLFFRLRANEPGWRLNANGKMNENGLVITFPSRVLYEQYPLDAAKAWSVWESEQKKYTLAIVWNCPDMEHSEPIKHINFRTPEDRDKFIEELKAIIEKHCI